MFCEVVGRGKIVSGRPERVTSSERFCIGVVEVAVAIFAANAGWVVPPTT